MTKFRLFSALAASVESLDSVLTLNGLSGKVVGVEKEDGSGHNFNVTLYFVNGTKQKFFVRTVD
jgi:hypothetical protein